MSTLTATQLQQQYIAYFGRPGDPAGITYWLSDSSGVSSAREFADKIYAQDEYKTSTVGGKSVETQVLFLIECETFRLNSAFQFKSIADVRFRVV